MKKYHIIDEDGKKFEVEELQEEAVEKDVHDEDEEVAISGDLTSDEIAALKRLAAVADKLIEMTSVHDEDEKIEEKEEEEEEDVEMADEDEMMEEEDKEEVIDTDKCRDSLKSFTSTEKRKSKLDDSLDTNEIDEAWNKRLNGGRK